MQATWQVRRDCVKYGGAFLELGLSISWEGAPDQAHHIICPQQKEQSRIGRTCCPKLGNHMGTPSLTFIFLHPLDSTANSQLLRLADLPAIA